MKSFADIDREFGGCKTCMRCRVCGRSVEFESQIKACHWCWTRREVRNSLLFGVFAGLGLGLSVGALIVKLVSQ